MAYKKNKNLENTGVDRLELFVQNYFKQIILVIGCTVILFITAYGVMSVYDNSQMKKADLVSEAEYSLNNDENITNFQDLSMSVKYLSNYIKLKASEAWVLLGKDAKALETAITITGDFKEMGDSLAYDLGGTVDINPYLEDGQMTPLWYYRLVLSSSKDERLVNLELFKSKYPENQLLVLLENWNE